jgi:hypothetical protein
VRERHPNARAGCPRVGILTLDLAALALAALDLAALASPALDLAALDVD